MKAHDVMSSRVITVGPQACVQDVADILLRNRISALPVIDKEGSLLGIVSEGDLMRRPEAHTEKKPSPWLQVLSSRRALANDFVKTHSQNVADVMTREVVTAAPDTPVGEIAGLLEKNNIKRVPIVQNGKVVGIVSRANLLHALASLKKDKLPKAAPSDSEIRARVLAQIEAQSWTRPSLMNVTVHDGYVDLWGSVDSQEEKKALRVLAEAKPGVRAANDHVTVFKVLYEA